MLRQALLNCDLHASRFFSLKIPAYIQEKYIADGAGVYSSSDWSEARARGYREAGENTCSLDSGEAYWHRIFTTQARNVAAALRLVKTLDLARYPSIVEVGCGEMVQAFVVKCACPSTRYKATDFDPYIIDKCSKLSLLDPIEKGILDISQVARADLAGFNLLIAWEVLYALDDLKVKTLLSAAAQAGTSVLVCTTQSLGPIRRLTRGVKNLVLQTRGCSIETQVSEGKLRMHGWNASLLHYSKLARESGMNLSRIWLPPIASSLGDDFTYLLFTAEPSSG